MAKPKDDGRTYRVYMYTNIYNGKRYIGQTITSLEKRAQKNGSNYWSSPSFYEAIQEYGWSSFEPIILQDNIESLKEANELERYYISFYHSNEEEYGYNIEKGGRDHGPEDIRSRTKISEAAKERYKDPTKNPNYGKHWDDSFKKMLSERMSGENHPFYGTHLSEERKRYLSSLYKGTQKTTRKKPYTSEELEIKRKQMKENSKLWSRRVRCIEDNIEFDTITEAAAYVNRTVYTMSGHLHGDQHSCGGKHFEFIDKKEGATTIENAMA